MGRGARTHLARVDQLAQALEGQRHVEVAPRVSGVDVEMVDLDVGGAGIGADGAPARVAPGRALLLALHVKGRIATHRHTGGGEQRQRSRRRRRKPSNPSSAVANS